MISFCHTVMYDVIIFPGISRNNNGAKNLNGILHGREVLLVKIYLIDRKLRILRYHIFKCDRNSRVNYENLTQLDFFDSLIHKFANYAIY